MHFLRDDYSSSYISTATTTQVYTGYANLVRIVITETAAGAITIYNETGSGTTDVKAVFKASIAEGTYELGITCSTGIKIVTAGASKLTVVYSKV